MQPGLGAVLVVAVVFLELAGDNIVAAGVVGAFAGGGVSAERGRGKGRTCRAGTLQRNKDGVGKATLNLISNAVEGLFISRSEIRH